MWAWTCDVTVAFHHVGMVARFSMGVVQGVESALVTHRLSELTPEVVRAVVWIPDDDAVSNTRHKYWVFFSIAL